MTGKDPGPPRGPDTTRDPHHPGMPMPLTVDEEPPPTDFGQQVFLRGWLPKHLRDAEYYATVDQGNSAAVIVWVLGAIVAALIVVVAWVAWTR